MADELTITELRGQSPETIIAAAARYKRQTEAQIQKLQKSAAKAWDKVKTAEKTNSTRLDRIVNYSATATGGAAAAAFDTTYGHDKRFAPVMPILGLTAVGAGMTNVAGRWSDTLGAVGTGMVTWSFANLVKDTLIERQIEKAREKQGQPAQPPPQPAYPPQPPAPPPPPLPPPQPQTPVGAYAYPYHVGYAPPAYAPHRAPIADVDEVHRQWSAVLNRQAY